MSTQVGKSMWLATLALGIATNYWTALAPAADSTNVRASLEQVDKVTTNHSVRASKIIGMEVRNEKGDKLGKVEDLVVDTGNAKIRYAALSFGGFLGMGDKYFAIPWSALQCTHAPDSENYYLVLNASPETLKQSPGFDKDHWPDFGSTEFTNRADQPFSVNVQIGRPAK